MRATRRRRRDPAGPHRTARLSTPGVAAHRPGRAQLRRAAPRPSPDPAAAARAAAVGPAPPPAARPSTRSPSAPSRRPAPAFRPRRRPADRWPPAHTGGARGGGPAHGPAGAAVAACRGWRPSSGPVTANGITQAVRVAGPPDGAPVLLIHGNCSSAAFWEPLVRHLPATCGWSPPTCAATATPTTAPVDATRGLRRLRRRRGRAARRPGALRRPAPGRWWSGTRSAAAWRCGCWSTTRDRVAGAAAGGAGLPVRLRRHPRPRRHAHHPRLRRHRRRHGEPRLRRPARRRRPGRGRARPARAPCCGPTYVADPASLGDGRGAAAGQRAVHRHRRRQLPGHGGRLGELAGHRAGRRAACSTRWRRPTSGSPTSWSPSPAKPPVTWVRGDADVIVSDTSLFDLAYLGSLGVVPGWPGDGGLPAAADGRPDPGGAGAVRGGRRRRTARWCCPAAGTARTWSGRRSSSPSCWR